MHSVIISKKQGLRDIAKAGGITAVVYEVEDVKREIQQLNPKELRGLEAMEMKRLYKQKSTYRQMKRFRG
ncbi:hypothetical protein [Natronincola ferrireducens]|uniref:Uncharacterized protein n=1 Tax=Natronincola ferrireducens TaxID=393762 RepID=A0A1G9A854_9FIRM|nr:hypothetical protein [Natronincola ferrireducens]SDK23519.1 hypothetical protein SAMN05660472_01087 [Natronincola ferrireducens]